MPWKCLMNCVRSQAEDVRQLDYQHSVLQDVPPEVFAYERTLEELYLDSNRIRDLPRPLFHCHGLKVLSLSDNEVQSLPPAIASLINLQHLDLSRNELCGIPDNIKGCKHLVYVDVSVNQLEKLPEGFTQLLSLEELYLNDTCLDFLPANFGRLTKLRILELRENNLNTLPKSIARLTSLERMDIGQNEFSDLPEVIGRLVNLTELWIDCNRIRCIQKFIGNLKKLMHLDASANNINWITPEIGSCCSLTDLTMSCNEITEIPETIGNLKMLVTLKLDDNQLTSLPPTIGKLSNLEELILSQNDFEMLPPCIGLLRKLIILNVDDNMLEELPPEIGSCTSLTILSVRSNKLQEVPAELGHLPKIRVMNLSDNQLQNLPVSILNLTYLTALWLSNNQSTPLTTLQQEVDKVTGQTVCVNFMLPQSSQELYLAENASEVKPEMKCSSQQRDRASERPHIRFATDTGSEMTGHLVRAPTPYPKELRAMAKHARSFQQQHTRRVSRESEQEVPLLGEMVSPGPKGVLIKEAKVTKPLVQPTAVHNKGNEEESCDGIADMPVNTDKHENPKTNTDENTPVLASGSGPVIREAKCIRQVTGTCDEHEKFLSQKEEPASPKLSVDIIDAAKSQFSITSEPPPYHIAAAYSKQAAYFHGRTSSPTASLTSQKPASPVVQHGRAVESIQQKINYQRESIPSAASLVVQSNNVHDEETGSGNSETQEVQSVESQETVNVVMKRDIDSFSNYVINEGNTSDCVAKESEDTVTPVEDQGERDMWPNAPLSLVDSTKYLASSPKCRIPVRLGEPPTHECDMLAKPSVFTQNKPAVDNSIFTPTPQRPETNPPAPVLSTTKYIPTSTPKSTRTASRAGSKIPSLLPSAIHGMGKSDVKSQITNNGPSPKPEKTWTRPELNSSVISNNNKSLVSNSWTSLVSDPNYMSPTRIPQPGFNSHSPPMYQSSKRSSISSESSGTIAPLNRSLHSSPSPVSKEAGYNYLNKPQFSPADHNLNISSRIPTATSQMNPIGNYESGSLHTNSSSGISSPSVSKIPTLSSSSLSPTSARVENLQQQLFSSNCSESSYVRSSLESPGRQTKTWMFGPHKNPTVFPVVIKKNPGLGFSITGGLGSSSLPEKRDHEGIFVSKVHPNGPASSCLLPGDKILEVDGTDFTKLEHDQAVGILKQTGNIVNMMISRQQ